MIDLEKDSYPAIAVIKGGADGGFFSIISYDATGERINLLVTTAGPYSGIRPLDVGGDRPVSRLEVEAKGAWSIDILPLTTADVLTVPGTYEGEGDAVLLLDGTADTATISGNQGGGFFSVIGYGSPGRDLMVTAGEPYEGKVVVDPETVMLEIQAKGEWSITVE